jgi:hypothetical protein
MLKNKTYGGGPVLDKDLEGLEACLVLFPLKPGLAFELMEASQFIEYKTLKQAHTQLHQI